MALLEKNIRKKWENMKDFLFVNIAFEKIREKDEHFNPKKYFGGDEEKYYEILQQ